MAFLYQNFNREEVFALTRVEQTINAGSFDIVINPSASDAFNFDSSTFTIRSSSFVSNLSTTGTVTDNTGSGLVQYSVTNNLVINNASVDWTIDSVDVGFIVNPDSTQNLVVDLINGATASTNTPGDGPGQVLIRTLVQIDVTVTDRLTGNPIQNAHVYAFNAANTSQVIFNGATDASGFITATFTEFEGAFQLTGWVRESNLTGIDYVNNDFGVTVSALGAELNIQLERAD